MRRARAIALLVVTGCFGVAIACSDTQPPLGHGNDVISDVDSSSEGAPQQPGDDEAGADSPFAPVDSGYPKPPDGYAPFAWCTQCGCRRARSASAEAVGTSRSPGIATPTRGPSPGAGSRSAATRSLLRARTSRAASASSRRFRPTRRPATRCAASPRTSCTARILDQLGLFRSGVTDSAATPRASRVPAACRAPGPGHPGLVHRQGECDLGPTSRGSDSPAAGVEGLAAPRGA